MIRLILLLIPLCLVMEARSQDWELVWSDEFEDPGLPDPAKWAYDIGGHGWGNQELQYYTDRPENARVEDGVLIIEAREEDYNGNPYTSARLVTRGRAAWQYGRIEARIKLPLGQGIWPAFWMLPTDSPYGGWPAGGEIDIMEYLGHEPDRVHGTLHYGGGDQQHTFTGDTYTLEDGLFAGEFHTFAIEWEPRRFRWFVDDELYQTQVRWSSGGGPYPAPFDNPFHILLNVAVGGEWPGYPDETTTFPQQMEVDYVRVYQDADAYPTVELEAPSAVEAGATIALHATASDAGEVDVVEFLQDGGVLGSDTQAPYELDVEGVVDGCYALRARATDDAGYTTETDPIELVVGTGCPDGSTAPYLMKPASIPGAIEAEYYDLGGPGVAYFDFSDPNEGSGIRLGEGVDIRPSRDDGGGYDITQLIAREWVSYTVDVAQTGTYRVLARAASGSGGRLRLALDGEDLFGDVSVASTGGDWAYDNTVLGTVALTEGRHTLRVDMRSAGFSLNRMSFFLVGGTDVENEVPARALSIHAAPNPMRHTAAIRYTLPAPSDIEIDVYDVLGRRVASLDRRRAAPGEHTADIELSGLAPGAYFCILRTEFGTASANLIVVP